MAENYEHNDVAKELQERLVQTCIDFVNEKGIDYLWAVYFRADSINESARFGEWTPATDSYIQIESCDEDGRKTIGEYM